VRPRRTANGGPPTNSLTSVQIIGVLVTYRRPEQLQETLMTIGRQTRRLDYLFVVDNDPLGSAAGLGHFDRYIGAGHNGGPAGGLRIGVDAALEMATDDAWILFLDDDDPPSEVDEFAHLADLAATAAADVGAVGRVGARYRCLTGQPVRVPDDDLRGLVEVDWVGGGQFPLYRAKALRESRPNASLFFGFDDLDLGLSLKTAGWRIIVDGDRWRAGRERSGRVRLGTHQIRQSASAMPWRRYYSNRNLILIARSRGRLPLLVSATIAIVRALLLARVGREHVRMSARGLVDGILGRSGAVVRPSD
jgi:GT2 family glycosyltransferase